MKAYFIEVDEGVYDSFCTFQWIGTDKEKALKVANEIKPSTDDLETVSISVWEDGEELVAYSRNAKNTEWDKIEKQDTESIEELEGVSHVQTPNDTVQ